MRKTTPVSAVSAASKRAVIIVHPRNSGDLAPFEQWLGQHKVPVVVLPADEAEADPLLMAGNVLDLPALVLVHKTRAVATLYLDDMTRRKVLETTWEKFRTCK